MKQHGRPIFQPLFPFLIASFSSLALISQYACAQLVEATPTPVEHIIAVNGQVRGMTATADGRYLYVSDYKNARVSRIDLATLNRLDITVPGSPADLALSPDESRLYVAESQATTLAVVDTATHSVSFWDLDGNVPRDIEATEERVYVAANFEHDAALLIIDAATGEIKTNYSDDWESNTGLIALDHVEKKLYSGVVDWSPSNLSRWDIAADTPVLETRCGHGALGSNGQNLTLSPNGIHLLFMTGSGNGGYGYVVYNLRALSASFSSRDGAFDIGTYPLDMVYRPDGGIAYGICGDFYDRDIKIMDTATQVRMGVISPDYVGDMEEQLKLCMSGDGANLFLYAEDTYHDYDGNLYMFTMGTPTPTPMPTATPLVDVRVSGTSLLPGEPFAVDVTVQPCGRDFDAWAVLSGPAGVYSMVFGKPGKLVKGARPLVTGVPGMVTCYEGRLLNMPAIPHGIAGMYSIIVALAPAGTKPTGIESAIPGYACEKQVAVLP